MIKLDYKDGRSLHEQIEAGIRELIINGIMAENDRLPSVRELSLSLTVNPNTVQKAYKQLEVDGFIYSIKGKGNFVAPVAKEDNGERIKELYDALEASAKELMFLGQSCDEINAFLEKIYSDKTGKE